MSWLADYSIAWLQRRPLWVRLIVGLVRSVNPIIKLGESLFVLRADDVRAVLERSGEFEIGFANSPKMLQGEFLLGMDPAWPRYEEDKQELEGVLGALRGTAAGVVSEESNRRFGEIRGRDQIDLVSQFAEPIVVATVTRVYGIGPVERSAVLVADDSSVLLGRLLRSVGSVIAFASPAPFGRQEAAELTNAELTRHLERVIAARHCVRATARPATGGENPKTVVDFLVDNELDRGGAFDSDEVRAKLAGLVLAGTTALVKAFTHTMHQFLKGDMGGTKREPLRAAIDAAEAIAAAEAASGKVAVGLRKRFLSLIFEALRFNPTFPLITRFCPRSSRIASGKPHGCEVPAGSIVVPVLISAMFDESVTPTPESFGYQRGAEEYLHFGYGQHVCLGRHWATDALTEMCIRALRWPGMADATCERIRYDGVAVERFVVRRKS
jgi:cytochrome P450